MIRSKCLVQTQSCELHHLEESHPKALRHLSTGEIRDNSVLLVPMLGMNSATNQDNEVTLVWEVLTCASDSVG